MNAAADGASIVLRAAEPRDAPRIAAIYAHHVLTGLASFETEPPDDAEIRRRLAGVRARGLPYLVAEAGGGVVGYAYAAPYRARPAYRYTLEDSVYVDRDSAGRGVGRRLLERLVAECAACGCRQLVAVIGDSANRPSIALHAACGFARVGLPPAVGYKLGRWVDSVLMQRAVGAGDTTLPAGGD
ncbi:MAG TPA: GNAT family N-acetyltransferase [Burkholderiales bacterium]|nr:GNAT family N-acetyltransferase [Burkholderiales bacterium]